ncbi:hypothetical protein EK21DRAFT_94051 [Setomelanomma holmii]|uniref:Uncharacterized protein n=1 Tax=Setomelanomma holmii TaxID=210430 RepID=A0A9P4GZK8_9PLEO|nr:hypothetical protein EK21DRAFT_94051 [Setomelanomma holmii]
MSQFGERAATIGPYGPDNPPPPPKDPPPSKVDRKRRRAETVVLSPPPQNVLSPQKPTTPRRRSTANQRRKLRLEKERAALEKERAELERTEGSWRSRSPSREGRKDGNNRRRESWTHETGSGDGIRYGRRGPPHEYRQPLREARQFTPDHIMDETYGRLTPGHGDRAEHSNPRAEARGANGRRGKGSRETSWSDQRSQRYGHARSGEGEANHQNEQYAQDHVQAPYDPKQKPTMMHSSQAYHMEDEVLWDEGENSLDVPERDAASFPVKGADLRLEQPVHWDEARYASGPFPPREPNLWQQRPWQSKDMRPGHKPYLGKNWKPRPYNPNMQFGNFGNSRAVGERPAHPGYPQNNINSMLGTSRAADTPSAPSNLLQDDPALIATLAPPLGVPSTVCDLRRYDAQVVQHQKTLPRNERFINGNGKVGPYMYGSVQGQDLGLCFSSFCTIHSCEKGVRCPWRHHPLTKAERQWILAFGKERGKNFLEKVGGFWANPEVPVPGANMYGK